MEKIVDFKKYPIIKEEYIGKKLVNPYVFFDTLSDYTLEDDIIIPDASANLVWVYQAYKVDKKQKILQLLIIHQWDIQLQQQLALV